MSIDEIFSKELKERFNILDSELYNLKHAFKLFVDYLEDETEIPLQVKCFALILNEYFNKTKKDFNKLEEDLGVLF